VEKRFNSFIAEWLTLQLPRVIERDISLPLERDYIITITGSRRSGKTFLLYQVNSRIN
jgi:predicted AAA+ superfamily ATPase